MRSNLFVWTIDKAAEICGGQNALARRIGADASLLAGSKLGKRRLNEAQLAALAELVEASPAELWELQELAQMPRRNPFGKSFSTGLAAFFLVNLSGCGFSNSVSASSTYLTAPAVNVLHIVAFAIRVRLVRLRLMFQRRRPMLEGC